MVIGPGSLSSVSVFLSSAENSCSVWFSTDLVTTLELPREEALEDLGAGAAGASGRGKVVGQLLTGASWLLLVELTVSCTGASSSSE